MTSVRKCRTCVRKCRTYVSNHLPGEIDENGSPPQPRGQRKGHPGPQRRRYDHLPVVDELIELPADRRVCPQCGRACTPSDTEDSEQLEIEVRAYRRRIRRRRYQRTCDCSGPRTVVAPPPPKLIPKGLLGLSVWALAWLLRIRELYRQQRHRLAHDPAKRSIKRPTPPFV